MRVRYQIGTVAPMPAPSTARLPARRTQHAKRPIARHAVPRGQSSIAVAVMVAMAGCATPVPQASKSWIIEPTVGITHTLKNSEAYYTLGRVHDGSLAWDKAVDAYRKAIAADAQNIEAYNALGVSLARAGRLADAETTLRQAVALAPDRAHVRSNLGYVLLLAGKPKDAVTELRAAVEQDRGNTMAASNLRRAMGESDSDLPVSAPASDAPAAGRSVNPHSATAVTISVPAPITVAEVQGPATATVDILLPLTTASLPAPPAMGGATTARAASTVPALKMIDTPTVSSIEGKSTLARGAITTEPSVNSGPPPIPSHKRPDAPAVRLEISNGNGVPGMASRVGRWLATQGEDDSRLTNQRPFVQQTTVVQYRAGQEAAAQRIARALPAHAVAASEPSPGLRSDVRVVLGHDWVQTAACLEQNSCRPTATAVLAAAAR